MEYFGLPGLVIGAVLLIFAALFVGMILLALLLLPGAKLLDWWDNRRFARERAEYERQERERFYGKDHETLLRPGEKETDPEETLLRPAKIVHKR